MKKSIVDFTKLWPQIFRTSLRSWQVRCEVQKFIMRFTNQFTNYASDWLPLLQWPIRDFVYKLACEFQYELANFATNLRTSQRSLEHLWSIDCNIIFSLWYLPTDSYVFNELYFLSQGTRTVTHSLSNQQGISSAVWIRGDEGDIGLRLVFLGYTEGECCITTCHRRRYQTPGSLPEQIFPKWPSIYESLLWL